MPAFSPAFGAGFAVEQNISGSLSVVDSGSDAVSIAGTITLGITGVMAVMDSGADSVSIVGNIVALPPAPTPGDYSMFKTRYPQFSAVDDAAIEMFAMEADMYMPAGSLTTDYTASRLAMLRDMLTAHIGMLSGVLADDGMPRPVGQITGATEGSVTVNFAASPGSGEWFQQTQPGAAFWRATAPLRSFIWVC